MRLLCSGCGDALVKLNAQAPGTSSEGGGQREQLRLEAPTKSDGRNLAAAKSPDFPFQLLLPSFPWSPQLPMQKSLVSINSLPVP